jgi:HK97 family phage prohead protease
MFIKQSCPFEMKSLAEGTSDVGKIGIFTGYASTFGNVDRDHDVIDKGAFGNIEAKRIKLLWQHSMSEPIGVWKSLKEDDHGLFAEGELNLEVQRGREAYALMKQGAIGDMSIGFRVPKGGAYEKEMDFAGGKRRVRHIKSVGLVEVSVVTMPANPMANVIGVKSDGSMMTERDFENFLRDAGFSKREALIVVSKGYKVLCKTSALERDAHSDEDGDLTQDGDDATGRADLTKRDAGKQANQEDKSAELGALAALLQAAAHDFAPKQKGAA